MKRFVIVLFLLVVFLANNTNILAIVNPLAVPNNKYGIHIVDENDLDAAAALVNGNGGNWGYITVVIPESDRDPGKWQRIFDRMRRLKVIPVVRLATRIEGAAWKKPTEGDAAGWADFLDSLNWVVKNRYVILFNEPNHAKEWGGEINPAEYAKIARTFHGYLKAKSEDFYILPAGFDQAARTQGETLDQVEYFRQMNLSDNLIFTIFDGWTIHAYPNPNFSGSPHDTGRGSIRGYQWETNLLSQYKVSKDIPIFIAETGWAHQDGKGPYQQSDIVAAFYEDAYKNAWSDERIVMVSPFVFNYQAEPFLQFSWKKPNSPDFFPQYYKVKDVLKTAGTPVQEDGATLVLDTIPNKLMIDSLFFLPVKVKNIGQKIWDSSTTMTLTVVGASKNKQIILIHIENLEPTQEQIVRLAVKTPEEERILPMIFYLEKDGVRIGAEQQKQVSVLKPASLWEKTVLFMKRLFKEKRPAAE